MSNKLEIKLKPLYPWQLEILNTNKRHILAICSRRAGKTEVAIQKAIREILKGKRVLWIAPFTNQLTEIYSQIYNALEPLITSRHKNHEIKLINGGQIWFRAAENPIAMRSLGYDWLIFDEMAHADDIMEEIRPTLADRGGRLFCLSTPNGMNHFNKLYEEVKEKDNWLVVQRDWTCSPHLKQAEIDDARSMMTEGSFRQEFMAVFTQNALSRFKSEWLEDIFVNEIPTGYQRSCIFVDLSLGRLKSDWQAIAFVASFNNVIYTEVYADRLPFDDLLAKVKMLYKVHKPEFVAFESNGFQSLAPMAFEKLFEVPPMVLALNNSVQKETRIDRLGLLLSQGRLKVVKNKGGQETFRQLADFPSPKQHDDCIDAIESGWRALIETSNF